MISRHIDYRPLFSISIVEVLQYSIGDTKLYREIKALIMHWNNHDCSRLVSKLPCLSVCPSVPPLSPSLSLSLTFSLSFSLSVSLCLCLCLCLSLSLMRLLLLHILDLKCKGKNHMHQKYSSLICSFVQRTRYTYCILWSGSLLCISEPI